MQKRGAEIIELQDGAGNRRNVVAVSGRIGRPPRWTRRQGEASAQLRKLHAAIEGMSLTRAAALEKIDCSRSAGVHRRFPKEKEDALKRLLGCLSPLERMAVIGLELNEAPAKTLAADPLIIRLGIVGADDREVAVRVLCRVALDKVADELGLDG